MENKIWTFKDKGKDHIALTLWLWEVDSAMENRMWPWPSRSKAKVIPQVNFKHDILQTFWSWPSRLKVNGHNAIGFRNEGMFEPWMTWPYDNFQLYLVLWSFNSSHFHNLLIFSSNVDFCFSLLISGASIENSNETLLPFYSFILRLDSTILVRWQKDDGSGWHILIPLFIILVLQSCKDGSTLNEYSFTN